MTGHPPKEKAVLFRNNTAFRKTVINQLEDYAKLALM